MKIVHLSYHFTPHRDPPDWIARYRFFYGIWEHVAQQHEVFFFENIDFAGIIKQQQVSYHFSRRNGLALKLPFRLNRAVRKQQPDVVFVHGLMSPIQVIMLRLQLGKRIRIVGQHHAEQPFRHWAKVALQRLADKCINAYFFTGASQADLWIKAGIIADKNKVKEVMEVSSVFSREEKDAARAAIGIGSGRIYLWVGHLNANKNPVLVVRAFLRFIKAGGSGTLYLVFQSNGLFSEIDQLLSQQEAASKNIILVGKVPHEKLQSWFSSADFIISSSYYEGSGVAVCEGMSCGCIPILTDIPSFRFMASNGCGLLYKTGNEDALFSALNKSAQLDVYSASLKTLQQYHELLSFEAISGRIQEELNQLYP